MTVSTFEVSFMVLLNDNKAYQCAYCHLMVSFDDLFKMEFLLEICLDKLQDDVTGEYQLQ